MKHLILALPLLLAACGKEEPPKSSMPAAPATSADRAKDPVCSMMVDRATAPARAVHEGATYYFCAEGCRKKFESEPKKFATPCGCGKTAAKCPCEHCGSHLKNPCDCAK